MSRMWSRWVGSLGLLVGLAAGCAGGDAPPPSPEATQGTAKDSHPPEGRVVLLLGTSLTAGYGLEPEQAWPALLQDRIEAAGLPFRAVNAGVSGETSAGALRRLDWVLAEQRPAVVMVETGANDGLRGQDTDSLRANLEAILVRLERIEPRPVIVVAGMEALPNLGAEYGNRFRSLFPAVARAHDAIFLPFLLDGVAGNPRFNQADGIHPNVEGSRRVADNVWRVLGPVLDSLAGA